MSQSSDHPTLSPEQLERVAAIFKVLGEPTRLRILQSICDSPRHVSEIVDLTGATQANVSKHLSLLLQAGVLQLAQASSGPVSGRAPAQTARPAHLLWNAKLTRSTALRNGVQHVWSTMKNSQ